jgi:hypothetical protein
MTLHELANAALYFSLGVLCTLLVRWIASIFEDNINEGDEDEGGEM